MFIFGHFLTLWLSIHSEIDLFDILLLNNKHPCSLTYRATTVSLLSHFCTGFTQIDAVDALKISNEEFTHLETNLALIC